MTHSPSDLGFSLSAALSPGFSEADLAEGPQKGLFGALGWTMGQLSSEFGRTGRAAQAICEAAE